MIKPSLEIQDQKIETFWKDRLSRVRNASWDLLLALNDLPPWVQILILDCKDLEELEEFKRRFGIIITRENNV